MHKLNLHSFLILFLFTSISLILSPKVQANQLKEACKSSEYLMQLRCSELLEFKKQNQRNSSKSVLNAQESFLKHSLNNKKYVGSFVVTSDGQTLVNIDSTSYSDNERFINVWNLDTGKLRYSLNNHGYSGFDVSSDGQILVTENSYYDNEKYTQVNAIKVWNLKTGKLRYTLLEDEELFRRNLILSNDGQTLVGSSKVGSSKENIKVWNLKTGKLLYTINDNSHPNTISLNGQTLVTVNHVNEKININLRNLGTGQLKHSYYLNKSVSDELIVPKVVISPNSKIMVIGYEENIAVIDIITGSIKYTLNGYNKNISDIGSISFYSMIFAISPDSETLVTSHPKSIKIWNLETGRVKNTLEDNIETKGHSAIAISPDNKTIVTGSETEPIKVWDLNTGKLKTTLIGHKEINDLAFTSNAKTLISVSRGSYDDKNKTIKVWQLP